MGIYRNVNTSTMYQAVLLLQETTTNPVASNTSDSLYGISVGQKSARGRTGLIRRQWRGDISLEAPVENAAPHSPCSKGSLRSLAHGSLPFPSKPAKLHISIIHMPQSHLLLTLTPFNFFFLSIFKGPVMTLDLSC